MLFFSNYLKDHNLVKEAILGRKNSRNKILTTSNLLKFNVGDILIVFF